MHDRPNDGLPNPKRRRLTSHEEKQSAISSTNKRQRDDDELQDASFSKRLRLSSEQQAAQDREDQWRKKHVDDIFHQRVNSEHAALNEEWTQYSNILRDRNAGGTRRAYVVSTFCDWSLFSSDLQNRRYQPASFQDNRVIRNLLQDGLV